MSAGLFKSLKELKPNRKKYRIKLTVKFMADKRNYLFSFIPTVVWTPWIYRHNWVSVVDIWWLHFHILIGKWEHLSCHNCKHQSKCVKSKKIEWYFDDVFENGEKCSDFEAR